MLGSLLEADEIQDGSLVLVNSGEPVFGPIQSGTTMDGMLDQISDAYHEEGSVYFQENGFRDVSSSHSCLFRRRYLIEADKAGGMQELVSNDECRSYLRSHTDEFVRCAVMRNPQNLTVEFEIISSEEDLAMLRFLFQLMRPDTVD